MRQLDLFSALQSSTKGIDTEFKSARGGVANTQGGTIVLGVAENSIGLVWEGVPDAAQLRTVFVGPNPMTGTYQGTRPVSFTSVCLLARK